MNIKTIKINNYVGIKELSINPGMINVFTGPKGSAKTSILEAISTGFKNEKIRTEVVKHGESEATIFIETDDHLEINRKIRTNKADYLKLTKQGDAIKSTEKELRKFISGDIFRPLAFLGLSEKERTKLILSMIDMNYSREQIIEWFGGVDILTNINTDKHLLMILKEIETRYYTLRQDVNRDINTFESQAKGIEQDLPPNYNGDEWENVTLQELYNAVSEAEKVNQYITNGNEYKVSYEAKLTGISDTYNNKIKSLNLKYRESESDLGDIIDLAEVKIKKAQEDIFNSKTLIDQSNRELEIELKEKIAALNAEYENKKAAAKKSIIDSIDDKKDIITLNETKISNKQIELSGLSEKKSLELKNIDDKKDSEIEKEKSLFGQWSKYLEKTETIDVALLKEKADNADIMRSHLREWDRMKEIRNVKIAEKQVLSDNYSTIIDVARNKPSDLIKQHKLPIDGISVDSDARIRINDILLDGLSEGEKLDAAFKIALQRMGELKVICVDGFDKLNRTEQDKLISMCEDNKIQAFFTITEDTVNGETVYSDHL